MSATERWLDEFAARATRSGFLRSAVAAAGALAFPLAKPHATPASNDPTACRKGCFWMAHKNTGRSLQGCADALSTLDAVISTSVNPFYGLATEGVQLIRYSSCHERALLTEKAAQWDCMQSDCAGFDPAQSGGPCEGCAGAGGHCCPDQQVLSGYSCCTSQGGCCDPSGDGCASGVTACGG